MSTKFSCREDEILTNLVKQHPALYNCKLKSYKDMVVKTNIWRKIAEELGKTENDCKARWKNIRDYYKKKRNEAVKEMGTVSQRMDNDFFQKYKHLSFLENTTLVDRKTVGSINDVAEYIGAEAQDTKNISKAADNTKELFFEATSEATTESIETPKGKKRACTAIKYSNQETQEPTVRKKRLPNEHNLVQEFYKSRVEKTALIKELLQTSQPQQDPAITMFFQSIAATVSKFTPQLQTKAKVAIMNIVAQLELDNISQQPLYNSIANFSTSSGLQFTTTQLYSASSRPSSSADSCSVSSPTNTDVSYSYSQSPSNTSTTLESQFSHNETI